MLKNTTRRSLSLAAVISLGVSALSGLPAQANTNVLVAPAAGTSYVTLVDQTFIIQAGVGAGIPTSNLSSLKWKIDKATGFTVSATASNTVTRNALLPDTDVNSTSTSGVITPAETEGSIHGLALEILGADAGTSSKTVTVTAWLDTLPNSSIDAGESSTTVTVTFLKYSEATSVVTLTQPIQGDTRVTASATLTGINTNQLTGDFFIKFSHAGAEVASVSHTLGGDAEGTALAGDGASRSATVSAQLLYKDGSDYDAVGAARTLSVTNQTIEDVTASAVVSANAKSSGSDYVIFRANTAFSVRAYTSTSSSETVVAGVPVTFEFSGAVLAGSKMVSVNGGAFTTSAVTVTATSGADGYATVNLITAGFTGTDSFSLVVRAQNQDHQVTLSASVPTFSAVVRGAEYRYATPGETLALTFDVADQFDVVSNRTNQSVQVTYVDADSETSTLSAAVVNGVAVVSVPVGSATGSATISSRLLTQDVDTLLFSARPDNDDIRVTVTTSAPVFDGDDFDATKSSAVAGTVTYSGSVSIPGATVVVAAQGIVFTDADGDTFSNQVSILTGADGDFAFTASGTVSGDYEIRATVGTDVMTSSYTVEAAVSTSADALSIAASSSALPGQTVDVTITVVDEYGNPVESSATSLSVVVSGIGYLLGGTVAQSFATDEDGQATFKVTSGTQNSGQIGIAATYNNGSSTVTGSATVNVAPAPVILAGSVDLTGSASVIDGSVTSYTATVLDAAGAALAGRTVTFTAAGAQGGLTITSGVSDADGKVSTTFVSTAGSRGTLVITATVDGKNDSVTTTVIEDPAAVAAREAAAAAAAAAAEAAAAEAAAAEAAAAAAAEAAAVSTVTVAAAESLTLGLTANVTVTVKNSADVALAGKTVVINVTGAGYVNVQSVMTDANGQATLMLISSAEGNAVITATSEGKSGNATVAIAAPVVTPTVEAVIGTFQGRWAVRVENATVGDRITIRVGGNWYQFDYSSETGSQLFSRKSKVGAIVDVTVWVNGSQKNVGLVTIK